MEGVGLAGVHAHLPWLWLHPGVGFGKGPLGLEIAD